MSSLGSSKGMMSLLLNPKVNRFTNFGELYPVFRHCQIVNARVLLAGWFSHAVPFQTCTVLVCYKKSSFLLIHTVSILFFLSAGIEIQPVPPPPTLHLLSFFRSSFAHCGILTVVQVKERSKNLEMKYFNVSKTTSADAMHTLQRESKQ